MDASEIVRIDENLTGSKYREILEQNLNENVEKMEIEGEMGKEAIKIIQDNDPKHNCRIAKAFYNFKPYEKLDFPPLSPDFNIIENVLAELKKGIDNRKPKNVEELWNFIQIEWKNISENKELLLSLVHSMPNRLQAVIEANGYATKY